MTRPSLKTIHFQGILLQKTTVAAEGNVHMSFQTRSGMKDITAHNPLLIPRLQIGVAYDIKGHEQVTDGEGYVRLMSAWPVIGTEPVSVRYGRKVMAGGVSLALLAVFAAVSSLPSFASPNLEEARSHIDTAGIENKDTFHTPIIDLTWSSPAVHPQEILGSYIEPETDPVISDTLQPPLAVQENALEQFVPPSSDTPPASSWDVQPNEVSPSNAGATHVQPSATLQPSDTSLRPTLEPASSSI